MAVLDKVFPSLVLVKTSHMRFLHCFESRDFSYGYIVAPTKYLLVLGTFLNETMGPDRNSFLAS